MRKGDRIGLDGFDPCAVLLNNDLSAGVPDILKDLEQTSHPAAARRLGDAPQVASLRRLYQRSPPNSPR